MNDRMGADDAILTALDHALRTWVEDKNPARLERWFGKTLDQDGVPLRLGLGSWWACLSRLGETRLGQKRWPRQLEDGLLGLLRAYLRFCRPRRGVATRLGSEDGASGDENLLRRLAALHGKAGESRVIGWLRGGSTALSHAPPPLPTWRGEAIPLAMLRPGWRKDDDLLAVDHRAATEGTRFELIGAGVSWLGPWWTSGARETPVTRLRVGGSSSDSTADLYEWSFRSGETSIARSAVLFRGRKLALLGQEVVGKGPLSAPLRMDVELAPEVSAEKLAGARGFSLRAPAARSAALVLPIGLPCLDYASERGSIELEQSPSRLSLRQNCAGRRGWLPLLVSWDPRRNRKAVRWRVLTVSENGKACPPDAAFAVRVSWGQDDTLLFYRSLSKSALRAFLGFQSRARVFVGRFTREGLVETMLSLD